MNKIYLFLSLILSLNVNATGIPVQDLTGSYAVSLNSVKLEPNQNVLFKSVKNNCKYIGVSEEGDKRQKWIFFEEYISTHIVLKRKVCDEKETILTGVTFKIDTPINVGDKTWIPIDGYIHNLQEHLKIAEEKLNEKAE